MEYYYPQPVYAYNQPCLPLQEDYDFTSCQQFYGYSESGTSPCLGLGLEHEYSIHVSTEPPPWPIEDHLDGLLSNDFAFSLESNLSSSLDVFSSTSPMESQNVSASSQDAPPSSFGLFLLESSEGSQSSTASLSNSPLSLLSSRTPLPAVPFTLPDCAVLEEMQAPQPALSQRGAKSKKSHRSHSSSSSSYSHSSSLCRRSTNQCPECSFKFARARDLKRHFRLHTGEKPYPCLACGDSFIRTDARGRHWTASPGCFAVHKQAGGK